MDGGELLCPATHRDSDAQAGSPPVPGGPVVTNTPGRRFERMAETHLTVPQPGLYPEAAAILWLAWHVGELAEKVERLETRVQKLE